MARKGVRVMAAGEGLAQGGGLDDALMGELLVRGRNDAQSRGSLIPPRHAGRLGRELTYGILILAVVGAVSLGRLLL